MTVTIYHNPRCSKSRETLSLLEEQNIEFDIVKYLDEPLSASDIESLYKALAYDEVRLMMRTKEALYKELDLSDDTLSDEVLFKAISKNPKLLERPIVIKDGVARMGRPPQQVLELFV
jgi:arsenate reductase